MSDEEASAPPAADAPVDPKPEDAPENGDSAAAPPAENGGGDAGGTKDTVRLYLGNLSYETDESKLRNIFSEFGEVTDVFLPSDRMSGRPRGELVGLFLLSFVPRYMCIIPYMYLFITKHNDNFLTIWFNSYRY